MSGIGYSVAFFADSDRALNPTQAELELSGASVFLWDGDVSLEERVMLDLPWEGVLELMALLIAEGKNSEDAVRAGACKTFSLDKTALHAPVAAWTDSPELRQAIGAAAKTKAWFKNADMGEKLGNLVVKHFPKMASTPFATNVDRLRAWIDEHE
jgi:putative ATP-dependent endonuclease of OLD family